MKCHNLIVSNSPHSVNHGEGLVGYRSLITGLGETKSCVVGLAANCLDTSLSEIVLALLISVQVSSGIVVSLLVLSKQRLV